MEYGYQKCRYSINVNLEESLPFINKSKDVELYTNHKDQERRARARQAWLEMGIVCCCNGYGGDDLSDFSAPAFHHLSPSLPALLAVQIPSAPTSSSLTAPEHEHEVSDIF
ncbi:hypothetical protein ACOSQ4_020906 [Xanthoceras sorbifolium]